MSFYPKNGKIIEINILTFLSKNFRFLTRENLIQMTYIKNITYITNEKLNFIILMMMKF